MGSHHSGGGNRTEGHELWSDRAPRDLAVRLADALQYEGCGPDDLWFEISDWLNLMRVSPPKAALHLVTSEYDPTGSSKYNSRTQQGSAMQLTRMIYTSKHKSLTLEIVDQILQRSRANNVRDNITGALIVGQNYFVQLIEGSRLEIGKCFMRIMADKRHHDIQVISCGDVSHRLFQEWSMHLIKASRIKEEIMSSYKINGDFNPGLMSEFAIEDMCRTLAGGNWDAEAA